MAKTESDVSVLISNMKKIYKNKSNDEYKCKGDIKKSPNYEMLKENIDNFIPKIKGYPPQNVKILQDSLKVLERPIWAKQVGSYMAEPDDTNIIYAAYFTLCYRLLFSEVMCAIVSAEATENGFVYEKDKITEKSTSSIKILKKLSENRRRSLSIQ